MIEYNQYYTF